jgi:hypothetical protein
MVESFPNGRLPGVITTQIGNTRSVVPRFYHLSASLEKRKSMSSNARKLAIDLANEIELHRGDLGKKFGRFPEGTSAYGTLERIFEITGPFEFDDAWRKKVGELPQFSTETWKQWARFAWTILLQISPERRPDLNPALFEGSHRICNVRKTRHDKYNLDDKGHRRLRKSRSIATYDVLEAFEIGFEEAAMGKSRSLSK